MALDLSFKQADTEYDLLRKILGTLRGEGILGSDPSCPQFAFHENDSRYVLLKKILYTLRTYSCGSWGGLPYLGISVSDELLDLTTAAQITFRWPGAYTLTDLRANVNTAPTGAAIQVDVLQSGVSILTSPLTIDPGDETSIGSASPVVIGNPNLLDDAEVVIDVTQIGSVNAGRGLKVWFALTEA